MYGDFVKTTGLSGGLATGVSLRNAPDMSLKSLTNLLLREKIHCHQHQQKIRNKHRRSGVIFSYTLAKEERKHRNGGNGRAVESNG
jgi:hypothetical protein